METVRRLIPQVDVDMDQLDEEEQEKAQSAAKERRNLEDVFSDKHGGVCSVKIRTLLRVSVRVYTAPFWLDHSKYILVEHKKITIIQSKFPCGKRHIVPQSLSWLILSIL